MEETRSCINCVHHFDSIIHERQCRSCVHIRDLPNYRERKGPSVTPLYEIKENELSKAD